MFRMFHFASAILMAMLSIGCGSQPSAQVSIDASSSMTIATPTPADQSLVPLITPTGESSMNTPDNATESNDDSANTPSQNDAGIIPGSPPSAPPPAPDESKLGEPHRQPTEWLTYNDSSFDFSIEYPDTYVITETADSSTQTAIATHSVHFQDAILAQSETANLQPSQFAVDVFEIPPDVSFEQWIDNNVTFSGSARDSVDIGGRQGYVVTLSIQLAPNQFYYVAGDTYYYKLTPLGIHGERMVQSFTTGT